MLALSIPRPSPWRSLTLALACAAWLLGACGASVAERDAIKQADYHYQLAANHFAAGETTQAIRELTLSLEQRPDHAEAQHLMGFLYMGRKQYPEAVLHFQLALEADPEYYTCLNNLGVAYLYMERWADAIEVYEKLRHATLYTSPWLAYANLGWAYYQLGRIDEGIEQTRMALFLNPEMCLAANNLGIMLTEDGQLEEALSHFEEAREQCPNYAEPLLHLGQLYAANGQQRQAKDSFRRCAELSPKSELGQRCRANAKMYR